MLIIRKQSLLPLFLFALIFGPKLFGTNFDLILISSVVIIFVWWREADNITSNVAWLFFVVFLAQLFFVSGGGILWR